MKITNIATLGMFINLDGDKEIAKYARGHAFLAGLFAFDHSILLSRSFYRVQRNITKTYPKHMRLKLATTPTAVNLLLGLLSHLHHSMLLSILFLPSLAVRNKDLP